MSRSRGSLNFLADEVRLDIELGQSFIADFYVTLCDTCQVADLSPFSLEAVISRPGFTNPSVSFQLTKSATVISAGLTQSNAELLYTISPVWNYRIWLVKIGFRAPAVTGPIVINDSILQDG